MPRNPEQVATLSPGRPYFPPSMAVTVDSAMITDTGGSAHPRGNLDYWWQQYGITGWNV